VSVSSGSEPIGAIFKVRFEDRLQDQQHCRLHYAIPYRRDPEGPQLAVGFGYIDSPHRFTPIGLLLQLFAKGLEPLLGPLPFDLLDADPVDPCCSAVGPDLLPGPLQRLSVTDQPVETVEAKALLLFGFCAQLRSPATDFFAGSIASLRVNSPSRFSVLDVSINQFRVLLSLLASRQGPFAPSGFHRLSSLLWAPPTPIPSSPKCYCLPLQTLQLDPSLGRASQVPGCSFRARCPTLPPGKPRQGFVSSPPPRCWLPFRRGFWPLSSSRFEAFIRRFTFVAAHSSAVQRLQTTQQSALSASCLMTLYMANSFHLARTTKLRLALRRRRRLNWRSTST
jgi:hypothetical protein